jgi:hypothetical protein
MKKYPLNRIALLCAVSLLGIASASGAFAHYVSGHISMSGVHRSSSYGSFGSSGGSRKSGTETHGYGMAGATQYDGTKSGVSGSRSQNPFTVQKSGSSSGTNTTNIKPFDSHISTSLSSSTPH